MTPVPHKRADDTDDERHDHERGWNGPSEAQWNELVAKQDNTHELLLKLDKAMFGEKGDGIDSDGGIVGEVRRLRDIRKVAWSALCVAGTGLATLIIDFFKK